MRIGGHVDTSNLELYVKPGCPYCTKVLRFMNERKIVIPLHDITDGSGNRDDLLRIGGKIQVPCLIINGAALYESSDIVAYLAKLS